MQPPTTTSPDPDAQIVLPGTAEPELQATNGKATPARRRRGVLQRWSRLVHVYSSMILLLLVLFFGVTGITLNHPEWTLGFHPSKSTETGAVPATALASDGRIELLALSEHLRDAAGVRGEISEYGLNATQGYLSYRGPGYAADVTIDVKARTYSVAIEKQGVIGVLNDLHKGRSTSALWGHVIDIAGALLVVTAIAGLTLQLALKRRRTSALVVAIFGGAVAAWVAFTTLA